MSPGDSEESQVCGHRRLPGLGYLWWLGVLLAGAARPSWQIPLEKAMAGPAGRRGGEDGPWQLIVSGVPTSSSGFIGCFQASKWVMVGLGLPLVRTG